MVTGQEDVLPGGEAGDDNVQDEGEQEHPCNHRADDDVFLNDSGEDLIDR